MARFSSSVVFRTRFTCRSELLATSVAWLTPASTSMRRLLSSSAVVPARLVLPNATILAFFRDTSFMRR